MSSKVVPESCTWEIHTEAERSLRCKPRASSNFWQAIITSECRALTCTTLLQKIARQNDITSSTTFLEGIVLKATAPSPLITSLTRGLVLLHTRQLKWTTDGTLIA